MEKKFKLQMCNYFETEREQGAIAKLHRKTSARRARQQTSHASAPTDAHAAFSPAAGAPAGRPINALLVARLVPFPLVVFLRPCFAVAARGVHHRPHGSLALFLCLCRHVPSRASTNGLSCHCETLAGCLGDSIAKQRTRVLFLVF